MMTASRAAIEGHHGPGAAPGRTGLAALSAAMLLAGAAPAAASDWHAVAAHPDRFVGQLLSFGTGYCGTGGPEGKNPELTQCSIGAGHLFVRSRTTVLSGAARARMAGCGGLDVYERSPFCRFAVRFVAGASTVSAATTGDARIPLLETGSLALD